jgi:tripartite-type tricarboxylate transporter receptor subunit TctC
MRPSRGTPKANVDQLSKAMRKVVEQPDTRDRFAALNPEPVGSTPQAFAAFLWRDIEKYRQIARNAGIVPQ